MRRVAVALALVLASGCGANTATRHLPVPHVPMKHPDIAYATETAVRLRDRSGAVRDLGEANGDDVVATVWSLDGRYVAWWRVRTLRVHDIARDKTVEWTAPPDWASYTAGATRAGFVLVDEGESGEHRMAVVAPAAVEATRVVPIAGIEDGARIGLLAASATRILVRSDEVASAEGGPETVYDVTPTGQARRLFVDGDTEPEGVVTNVGMYAVALVGDTLLYGGGASAGPPCDLAPFLVTRDLGTNREQGLAEPAGGWTAGRHPMEAFVGSDGHLFFEVTTIPADCINGIRHSAVFRYDASGWAVVDRDATWGATSADHRLAVIRTGGDLVVGTRVIDHAVRVAAWAPHNG